MIPTNLILRETNSPFVTPYNDINLNSVLSRKQLDGNFVYLKGEVIYTAITNTTDVTLKKLNGNDLIIDLSSFTGQTINQDNKFRYIDMGLFMLDNGGNTTISNDSLFDTAIEGYLANDLSLIVNEDELIVFLANAVVNNTFYQIERKYLFPNLLGKGTYNAGDFTLNDLELIYNITTFNAPIDNGVNVIVYPLNNDMEISGLTTTCDDFNTLINSTGPYDVSNINTNYFFRFLCNGTSFIYSYNPTTSGLDPNYIGVGYPATNTTDYTLFYNSSLQTTQGTPSQLEKIIENGKTGYRILGRDPNNYGNIGSGAIDFSNSTFSGSSNGATGDGSFAEGLNTIASGGGSHAEGELTIASGLGSHAEGKESVASGQGSHAEGSTTISAGAASHAEGSGSRSNAIYSHAEGLQSISNGLASHAEGRQTTANGDSGSHAEGFNTQANGMSSHAEGRNTIASGVNSHVEGSGTTASGNNSHAEGLQSISNGLASHAEGQNTIASGTSSHSEGFNTQANGSFSHAEGADTRANGPISHAEGNTTQALGSASHAEGVSTLAVGNSSHAEGNFTLASGTGSHAEGLNSRAFGDYSHAEGASTNTFGESSHAEGSGTTASGFYTHSEGIFTYANGIASHAEGSGTTANGNFSHVEGVNNIVDGIASHAEGSGTTASGNNSHAEGIKTIASGFSSHAEGQNTIASGISSHAEGLNNVSSGPYSHTEGRNNIANQFMAHAEGENTLASGQSSHTEGGNTIASGNNAHAEGASTTASGNHSHSEGSNTIASGITAHAEGNLTLAGGSYSHAQGSGTTASGIASHAEGAGSIASGSVSHAEGSGTTASGIASHAEGRNTIASGDYSHAGGSGTTASGANSFVHGGRSESRGNNSIVLGRDITGTTNDTTYVDNLNIHTQPIIDDTLTRFLVRDSNGFVREINGTTPNNGFSKVNSSSVGTYSSLSALTMSNSLIIGNKYILTDYQTKYIINGSDSSTRQQIHTMIGSSGVYSQFSNVPNTIAANGDIVTCVFAPSGATISSGQTFTIVDYFNSAFIRFSPSVSGVANFGAKFRFEKQRYSNIPNNIVINDINGKPVIKPSGVLNTEVHDNSPYMSMNSAENPSPITESIVLTAIDVNKFSIAAESLTFVGDTLLFDFNNNIINDDNGNFVATKNGTILKRTNVSNTISLDKDWRVQRYRRYRMDDYNWNQYLLKKSLSGLSGTSGTTIYSISGINYCTNNNPTLSNEHRYIVSEPSISNFYIDFAKTVNNPFLSGTTTAPNTGSALRFLSNQFHTTEYSVDMVLPLSGFSGTTLGRDLHIIPILSGDSTSAVSLFKVKSLSNSVFVNNSQRYGNSQIIYVDSDSGSISDSSFMSGPAVVNSGVIFKLNCIDYLNLSNNNSMYNINVTGYGLINNRGTIINTTFGQGYIGASVNEYAEYYISNTSIILDTIFGSNRVDAFKLDLLSEKSIFINRTLAASELVGKTYLTQYKNFADISGTKISLNSFTNQIPAKGYFGYVYDFNTSIYDLEVHNFNDKKDLIYNQINAALISTYVVVATVA